MGSLLSERVDELMNRARLAASGSDPSEVLSQIERCIETAGDDAEAVGRLKLARAIALQCAPDPILAADAAADAAHGLQQLDGPAIAAYASAAASVMRHRAGDVDGAVGHAVDSLVSLADADPADPDALSASNALAQVFAALSAFGMAADVAAQTFDNAGQLDMVVRGHYAYSLGYCSLEAASAHPDDGRVGRWVQRALDAADYLETDTVTAISQIVAAGFRCEVALIHDDAAAVEAQARWVDIATADDHDFYPDMGDRLVAWHRSVRAGCALAWGSAQVAVDLLDLAIEQFERLGDEHRRTRASIVRTRALLKVGEPEAAASSALALVEAAQASQARQTGRLALQIAERAEAERARTRLRHRATEILRNVAADPVTGLGSRVWLEAQLDELARHAEVCGVLMFDLDRFKSVNDRFGHVVGDAVLGRVGSVLADSARRDDIVARFGGEEFVVVVVDASERVAVEMAERVRSALASIDWNEYGEDLTVTTSVGVAVGSADQVRDVLRLADLALYDAKRDGRDRVVVADDIVDDVADDLGVESARSA